MSTSTIHQHHTAGTSRATTPGARAAEQHQRRAAGIAGLGYVALFVLAIFANFSVIVRYVDPGDPSATFANLAAHDGQVRLAIVAFLVIFLIDVVVAWALHQLLRPTGEALSLLAAWFRIVYTVFLGVALVSLFLVLQLVGGREHLAAFDQSQLESQAALALEAFDATWLVGLAAFGVHLVLVGAIILRSGIASPLLGALLVAAGAAYVFDTTAYTLLPSYADHEVIFTSIVAVPSIVAEFSFLVWLLRRSRSGAAPVQPLAATID